MPNRAARRAAMRESQKFAANPTSPEPIPTSNNFSSLPSPQQLAANRANAQLSCGPKTPAGKAVSSLNAVKSALTGRTVLLPSDDAEAYRAHIAAHQQQFQPVGPIESDLVQAIADHTWRLHRIASLEHALYATGRLQFADQFADIQDPAERAALIDLHTAQARVKELRNLHLQESRLTRYRRQDLAELNQFQQQRRAKREAALREAADLYLAARQSGEPFTPTPDENGFVFSLSEIERFLAAQPPSNNSTATVRERKNHSNGGQNASQFMQASS